MAGMLRGAAQRPEWARRREKLMVAERKWRAVSCRAT